MVRRQGTDKLDACELEALRPADTRCAADYPDAVKSEKYSQCSSSDVSTIQVW
jgi:hypothetical protein